MNTLETILETLKASAVEGNTTMDIELQAVRLIHLFNVESVFKGFQPEGAKAPYEFVTCVSVNNEVIHGLPSDRKLEEGDVVKIDMGIRENGLIYDAAVTVLVGTPDKDNPEKIYGVSRAARDLFAATKEALAAGIAVAKAGNTNFTITEAIEAVAKKHDLSVVHGYGGHGVGEKLHEEPFIANRAADIKGEPFKLESGMRIAIEPMFCTTKKGGAVEVDKNGWTVKLPNGLAAHFESTITIP